MQRHTRLLAITAVALAVLVAAAFGIERYAAGPGREPVYRLTVRRDGRTLRTFTVAELEKLGTKSVKMQGLTETGPPLLSVLRASGVDTFTAVSVSGLGARDSGRLELTAAQVDERVLLDIAKRGTTKICGPDIAYAQRVRDVEEVAVR